MIDVESEPATPTPNRKNMFKRHHFKGMFKTSCLPKLGMLICKDPQCLWGFKGSLQIRIPVLVGGNLFTNHSVPECVFEGLK